MPLRAVSLMKRTTRYSWACIVVAAAFLYNLPRFFDSCIMTFTDKCTGELVYTEKVYSPTFNNILYFDLYILTTYIIFLYVGPLATLSILNYRLIQLIRRSTNRQRRYGTQPDFSDCNATFVLVIVVIVFIICDTPELILKTMSFIDRIFDQVNISPTALHKLATVTEFLMVINSSTNFFVYCAFGRRFRFVMKETFRYMSTTSTPATAEIIPLRVLNKNLMKL